MPEGNTPAPAQPEAISRADKLNTRAAGVVGLAVLCSRVLGLAREQIFAALFGGGRVMDAFTIAFRIPNLLRDLFAEGALSTAFVTVFTRTAALQDGARTEVRIEPVAEYDTGHDRAEIEEARGHRRHAEHVARVQHSHDERGERHHQDCLLYTSPSPRD